MLETDYTDNENISNSNVNSIVENFCKWNPSIILVRNRFEKKASLLDERTSTRSPDRKNIDNRFRELTEDFSTIFGKLKMVYDCITEILDKVEDIESRVSELEKKQRETNLYYHHEAFLKPSYRKQTNA